MNTIQTQLEIENKLLREALENIKRQYDGFDAAEEAGEDADDVDFAFQEGIDAGLRTASTIATAALSRSTNTDISKILRVVEAAVELDEALNHSGSKLTALHKLGEAVSSYKNTLVVSGEGEC